MDTKDQKLAKEIAEQRLMMIAPLLDDTLAKEDFYEKRRQICKDFEISDRTIGRYLDAYHESGIDELKPKGRVPECNPVVSKELLAQAIELRREVPSRSVPTIIQISTLRSHCRTTSTDVRLTSFFKMKSPGFTLNNFRAFAHDGG